MGKQGELTKMEKETRKKTRVGKGKVCVSIYADIKEHKQWKELAARNKRSLSSMVSWALDRFMMEERHR
jgi:hypothetical protein